MASDKPDASSIPAPTATEGGNKSGSANGDGDRPLGKTNTSVKTQVEGLVDMLAWIRIELAAQDPGAVPTTSQRVRIKRALVQVEMALAMAKELANELRILQGQG
jgi:hypothetical protein